MDKTPDAYRTISEVADDLDLPQHVLRFWETRFGQIKPLKRAGGRRFYRPDDVDLLKGIRHLLYNEGYTIKGVQRILKDQGVRAILALVRNNGLEAEPEAAPYPPAVAPAPITPAALQPAPTLLRREALRQETLRQETLRQEALPQEALQQEPACQASLRQEPPPLATPQTAPEWRSPLDLEAEFAAFHASDGEDAVPQEVAHTDMLPALPLPAPLAIPSHPAISPFMALPLSFGVPFQVPLAPNPAPGQVSMFRGGIAVHRKSEPQQTSEAPPLPPLTSLASAPVAPAPVRREEHEAEEARAVLTLALQELGTCREMIEQLRAPLRAAE